jgi:hypothetical protein
MKGESNMGLRCTCGVLVGLPFTGVEAIATNEEVTFEGFTGTRRGTLRYTADVCADSLDTSTVTISFVQTSGETPNLSFTGTSTEITSVVCNQMGMNCEITVTGTIETEFGTFPFTAEFRDIVDTSNVDQVQIFEIDGFFNQQGDVPVPQLSVQDQGCAEM